MLVRSRVPRVELRAYRPPHVATRLLTRRFCEEQAVMPVNVIGGSLIIAMANPDDRSTIDEEALMTGLMIEVVAAMPDEIADSIANCYGEAN